MRLEILSDEALQASIEKAVQTERDSTSIVLHHLREVGRRRLYSKLKYPSLKDYAVKHLKYSESEAWLRISAMQLLKELPQIEPQINDGSLPLSNLVLARRAFSSAANSRRLEKTQFGDKDYSGSRTTTKTDVECVRQEIGTDVKLAVLKKLENVSKREALKILEEETGVSVKGFESTRELSDGNFEIKSIITSDSLEIIQELKGLLAHSHPNLTNGELIALAIKALRREIDPALRAEKQVEQRKTVFQKGEKRVPVPEQAQSVSSKASRTRYIPAAIRHNVWLRDKGACTNCGSKHAIQFEHEVPVARGGETSVENIKLLCRSCNQRAAIEQFGLRKMQSFLKSPTSEYRLIGESSASLPFAFSS